VLLRDSIRLSGPAALSPPLQILQPTTNLPQLARPLGIGMDFRQRPPASDGANPSAFHFPSTVIAASAAPFLNPSAHRRAFSSFSDDQASGPGVAATHSLSGNIFAAEDLSVLGYDDGGDNGDPKRRRIARVRSECAIAGMPLTAV
jgi:hypothetical protein